ncbi:hypothetical protein BAE44_0002704 [Dichanthelium oligosanthes]|uniref:Nuclease associated modular domain-containing protein n=1 Tax=Dichanthelium oligosanthes TaxID=888268 RepID=A0A1E5WFT4_9POAL|nr:hypothetical protein BAE44_0002704 [Dichanthelium oligosanthes]
MAPQLQGCYWISSWPRLQLMPSWPRSSDSSRRRLMRLAPTRRACNGAVRVVADADLALGLDGGTDAVGIQFLTEEQEDVDERERLRRMRISRANKGNTPWNKGRKHSPETLQRIRERTRIAMQDPKAKRRCRYAAFRASVKKNELMHLEEVIAEAVVATAAAVVLVASARDLWRRAKSLEQRLIKPSGAAGVEDAEEAVAARDSELMARDGRGGPRRRDMEEGRSEGAAWLAPERKEVKKKLMNLGHSQSEETRVKISKGVRRGWSLRLQRLMVQDGCFVEWRDMVADAARKGFAGGVGLQWNSYKILTEQMQQEWLGNLQRRRSMPRPRGNRRAPKTPEQRRKIAEAIAAKWLDQEYRERVCSGIASYHGSSTGTKTPRKPRPAEESAVKREAMKKIPIQARAVSLEDAHGKGATVKRKKSATPYKDPMAGEKLEMLSKIRAQRAALEIEKKEAIQRARSLIAEAEKAADALETAAAMSPFAQASLIEARNLVTEARVSLECVDVEGPPENACNDMSEDSALLDYDHRLETQNESNVLKQENKSVNGIKFHPSNANGISFHFDVSAFTGIKQLYQRIEDSMERAFLLPSASSKLKAVNGDFGILDFQLRQSMINELAKHDCIAAESTDPPGTLEEDAPRSAENAETRENCPPGTVEEDTPSCKEKAKMRWVRGRLVKVEN